MDILANTQFLTQRSLPKPAQIDPTQLAKVEKTAKEFESVFISQMLQYGFEGISSDPTSGEEGGQGGFASDTYREMLLNEYGKLMSATGGIGIAQHIKEAMLQNQEIEHV